MNLHQISFLNSLPPLLLGIFVICVIYRKITTFTDWILIILIGSGVGIGFGSISYFIWSVCFSPDYRLDIYFGIEWALVLIIGIIAISYLKKPSWIEFIKSFTQINLFFSVVFAIIFIFSLDIFYNSIITEPFGNWDAVAIWNQHARFMFFGQSYWKDAFNPYLHDSHPDYPYLLPAFIAYCWSTLGQAKIFIPVLIGAFFTFGSAGILYASLARFRNQKVALLAASILLSSVTYVKTGSGLVADIPLSFYLLSLCVLTVFYFREEVPHHGVLLLMGLMLGFIVWTKNDGWSSFVAFLLSWVIVALLTRNAKLIVNEFLWILLGFSPIFLLILYYKIELTPPSDYLAQGYSPILRKFLSLERYRITLRFFVKSILRFENWPIPFVVMAFLYWLLIGFSKIKNELRCVWTIGLFLVLSLTGYFFIYILTPYGLTSQLSSSLSRLFMHLFPGVIFLFFYLSNPLPTINQFINAARLLINRER